MRLILFLAAALLFNSTAFAERYTSPSGYLEIIGYKLRLVNHNGKPEIAVSGSVEALADCAGAILLFDVLDRDGKKLGTFKIVHGEAFRHDGWELGPGTFTPEGGDVGSAVAAADHVTIHEADCTKRR